MKIPAASAAARGSRWVVRSGVGGRWPRLRGLTALPSMPSSGQRLLASTAKRLFACCPCRRGGRRGRHPPVRHRRGRVRRDRRRRPRSRPDDPEPSGRPWRCSMRSAARRTDSSEVASSWTYAAPTSWGCGPADRLQADALVRSGDETHRGSCACRHGDEFLSGGWNSNVPCPSSRGVAHFVPPGGRGPDHANRRLVASAEHETG